MSEAPVKCWLGPYFVRRGRGSRASRRKTWQIVTSSGYVEQAGIDYKVDAEARCAALNLAGGVVRPVPPVCRTTRWRRAKAKQGTPC